MRTALERLDDILTAIAKIHDHVPDRFEAFGQDEMVQVWVIHHLQVIGEAARRLAQPVKDRHTEVRWPEIIALRNILVHEYFGLNLHQIWILAYRDLQQLENQMRQIRAEIAASPQAGDSVSIDPTRRPS